MAIKSSSFGEILVFLVVVETLPRREGGLV